MFFWIPAVDAKVRTLPDGQSAEVFAVTGGVMKLNVRTSVVCTLPVTAMLKVTMVTVSLSDDTVVLPAIFLPVTVIPFVTPSAGDAPEKVSVFPADALGVAVIGPFPALNVTGVVTVPAMA